MERDREPRAAVEPARPGNPVRRPPLLLLNRAPPLPVLLRAALLAQRVLLHRAALAVLAVLARLAAVDQGADAARGR